MENITAANPEQVVVEKTIIEGETKVETNVQPGNIFTRMRLDKAFSPAESKWIVGTSYRVSNRSARRITLMSEKNI